MNALHTLKMAALVCGTTLILTAESPAAEKCCECGCEYKLKKVYHPVVTFKECTFEAWDYKTVCDDVLVPTTKCCKKCGSCDGTCSCPGKPKKMTVPVAVPHKCHECVRKVPVVTWVVECKCEKCCKKCKHGCKHSYSIAERPEKHCEECE